LPRDLLAWTLPANQATENWMAIPENWDALRRRWEYSQVNAALTFLALCLAASTPAPRRG
jgi:hypothetical protein